MARNQLSPEIRNSAKKQSQNIPHQTGQKGKLDDNRQTHINRQTVRQTDRQRQVDDMIIYTENPKELMNKNQLLEVLRNLSKASGYKIYIQISIISFYKI